MTTWTTFDGDVALIVDDMPENLSLLSDALSDAGYTVLVATDGLSALDRLQKVIPDIILLDAVMPGIDGFETCRRIKQMEAVRHVPVIFMTGLQKPSMCSRDLNQVGWTTSPSQLSQSKCLRGWRHIFAMHA